MRHSVNIQNKKAQFNYFFLHTLTAGIQLLGTEVKSIRDNKSSLIDSYCYFKENELFLKGFYISPGKEAFNHDPIREKKLLLNRSELNKLQKELNDGLTIIIKRIFTNENGLIKAEIALAKGKKLYDKRNSIKEKDIKRENDRVN